MKSTKTRRVNIPTNPLSDTWSDTKATLAEAAAEQVEADIALTESAQALQNARQAANAALARKTTAERRLANLRSKLSVQVGE